MTPYRSSEEAAEVDVLRRSQPTESRSSVDGPGRNLKDHIVKLQRLAGNAAVGHFLGDASGRSASQSSIDSSEESFEVSIRKPDHGREPIGKTAPVRSFHGPDLDAEEESSESEADTSEEITEAIREQVPEVPQLEPGDEITLPDLTVPESLVVAEEDSVAAVIDYEPTVRQEGAVEPFGSTKWNSFTIAGLVVRSTPGAFSVRFRLINPITFNVASPKPSVASESDPVLTNANYLTAVSDLTPNMSHVQRGRPPRTHFWARDLTTRHERFHSDERRRYNRAGTVQAEAWLREQTASTLTEVTDLVAQIPGRVKTASQASVGTLNEKESRAYSDGAPDYKARADAIAAKGALGPTGGGYP